MVREMDFVDECYDDNDLSLLKKLTLIIPTYNRNYYLSRCLWYHAHFPFGQIIVADSSPEEKKVVNRETVSKVREMFGVDILYLEYEPETEKYGGDIYRKWGDAVMHVETEYSQICTDKEYIIPTYDLNCLSFLENNSDYNTADGCTLFLRADIDGESSHKISWSIWTPNDKTYDMDDTFERVIDALDTREKGNLSNWNILTAIRRTQFQKWIYQQLDKYSLNDIRFGDFTPQLLSIVCSKRMHIQSEPYRIRDLSCLSNQNGKVKISESSAKRYPQISEYFDDDIIDDKVASLKKCLLEYFCMKREYDYDTSVEYCDVIVTRFLKILGVLDYDIQKRCPFINYAYQIYQKSPLPVKILCQKILGKKEHYDYLPLDPEENNITHTKYCQIISEITSKTLQYHASDSTIIYKSLK